MCQRVRQEDVSGVHNKANHIVMHMKPHTRTSQQMQAILRNTVHPLHKQTCRWISKCMLHCVKLILAHKVRPGCSHKTTDLKQ